jgi:hypothetical protein
VIGPPLERTSSAPLKIPAVTADEYRVQVASEGMIHHE